ncbi:MAG: PP2C family protein-serine/threonine phosphatase [Planctomycetaceae bacterium]
MGIALVLFLTWDYRREVALAVDTKHANLANEAVAIQRAVDHLLAEGEEKEAQSYINAVCHQMRTGGSHHHTIIVESRTGVFSSHGAHEKNRQLLSAIKAAPSRQVEIDDDLLVVGTSSQPGMTVYIAESLIDTRRNVRRLLIGRLAALAALGMAAMFLVNFVVLRIVGRPIRRLVETVDRIRIGDYIEPDGAFSTREFAKLAAAMSMMSNTLREDEIQRRSQMEKARQIQQHLLPGDITVPGLALAAWFAPAQRVAGDYYDAIPLSDGTWLIALADVSGHGVPSALEAAMLKVLLGHASAGTHDPAEILRIVNGHFVDAVPDGDFASMFLLRWSPNKNRVEYANAGHIPGLFQTSNEGITELAATGSLVGIDKHAAWETRSLSIQGNERLFLVSDGVIECQTRDGVMFGTNGLKRFFEETSLEDPETMIRRLQSDIARFTDDEPLLDDTTALAIRFANGRARN